MNVWDLGVDTLKRSLNPDCRERERERQVVFIVIHLTPVLSECSGTTAEAKGMQFTAGPERTNRSISYIYLDIPLWRST